MDKFSQNLASQKLWNPKRKGLEISRQKSDGALERTSALDSEI